MNKGVLYFYKKIHHILRVSQTDPCNIYSFVLIWAGLQRKDQYQQVTTSLGIIVRRIQKPSWTNIQKEIKTNVGQIYKNPVDNILLTGNPVVLLLHVKS